jgi:Secretion system C-terminal sorting domain
MRKGLLLILGFIIFSNSFSQRTSTILAGGSPYQDSLWTFDTTSYNIISRLQPTLSGFNILKINGLAIHPVTRESYAILQVEGIAGRVLVKINLTTGVCTSVGNTGDNFATIAFNANGTLFGITGDNNRANPGGPAETMYRINITDATTTLFRTLGNGGDGEAIAYCPDNNYFYHWSGIFPVVWERFDTSGVDAIQPLVHNGATDETYGAVYLKNGRFLMSNGSGQLRIWDTLGNVGPIIATPPDFLRGLILKSCSSTITTPATAICAGANTLLTSTGGLNYQWYQNGVALGGETNQTLTVTTAGLYNVILTDSCGFTDSIPTGVRITVNPLPTIAVAPNGQCSPVLLTASGTSNTYAWSPATGLSATTGASVTANPSTNTTYTVTGTITATGCTNSASASVVATPTSPVVTPAATSICLGNFTQLTATTNAFPAAVWSPVTGLFTDNTATTPYVAGTATNTVWAKPTTTQTYSVTSTSGSCVSPATSVTVTVYQPITITTQPASQTVCQGANVTFSVVTAGNFQSYQWQVSTNGGTTYTNIAGANNASLILSAVTTTLNNNRYRVIITNTCFTVTSNGAILTVNALSTVTATSLTNRICLSDTLVPLTGSPVGGSWSGAGVSGFNFIPLATAVGTYTLTYSYTNASGCTSSAKITAKVEDCAERIRLLRNNAVLLYPNPNSGRFNIRINSPLYNYLGMRVYTEEGLLIRVQNFSGLVYGRVVPIDMTNLPAGVYIVKFYYDDGVRTSDKSFKVIIGGH